MCITKISNDHLDEICDPHFLQNSIKKLSRLDVLITLLKFTVLIVKILTNRATFTLPVSGLQGLKSDVLVSDVTLKTFVHVQ